ncbi:MAG TPA: efflux transporter outer membrane subunit [Vicinamibacterales bacterium]|nr:efflux transporter outer membrane subunit [Vicinamibacterales bacterium]
MTTAQGVRRSQRRHGSAGRSALLLLFLVGGCAKPAPYVTPSVETTPAFKEDPNWKVAAPADATLKGNWWEVFADSDLNALEQQIAVSNETLKAAEAQLLAARAAVRIARASFGPQVSTAPTIALQRQSANRAISNFHDSYADYLLPVDVSYEADVWGRIRQTVNVSQANAQAVAADLQSVSLSLHAELASDYFSLRGLDRERDLLDNTVAAYQRALELTTNRYRGGIAAAADVAQAQTQLESTRGQTVDVGISRASFEHAIAVLVGRPAAAFSLAASALDAMPPSVPPVVPSQLLERRPDVSAAERRVAEADAQVGLARTAFYPVLTLSGITGFEASSFGGWLAAASNFWLVGPTLAYNIFDSGRRRATATQARAEYQQATAQYRDTVLSAFREVEDQLSALRILREEATIQDGAVTAAERSLELANNRYRGGVVTYLEVITAQSIALNNQQTAVGILVRRMNATVALIKAIGGGY